MYGSECWCLRKEDERRALLAEMNWLRRIGAKTRRDRIQSEVIRGKLAQTETLASRISKRRLTWFRHMAILEDKRLPAKALYCYVDENGVEEDNTDMNGQRETRPCRRRHRPDNVPVYYQGQREVEASSKKSLSSVSAWRTRKEEEEFYTLSVAVPHLMFNQRCCCMLLHSYRSLMRCLPLYRPILTPQFYTDHFYTR